MSKVALANLMQRISKDAKQILNGKDAVRAQRPELNRYANAISIDLVELQTQTLKQVEMYYKAEIKDFMAKTQLKNLVNDAFKALVITAKQKMLPVQRDGNGIVFPEDTSKLRYELVGNVLTAYAFPSMTRKGEATDNYDRIYTALFKNTKSSNSDFKNLQDKIEQVWVPKYLPHAKERAKMIGPKGEDLNLFDIGHAPASNIEIFTGRRINTVVEETAEQTGQPVQSIREGIRIALSSVAPSIYTDDGDSILVQVASKFSGNSKQFIITTKPESSIANRAKTEQDYIPALNRNITEFIKEQGPEFWVNHPGSDSMMRAIAKEMMQSAARNGFKVSDPSLLKPIDKSSNLVKDRVKGPKTKKIINRAKVGINIPGQSSNVTRRAEAATSYISLITLLNSKLPPQVRRNMGAPRLVNRTGRLSESARVTNIVPTAQGFPSIEYTYQRAPYDVFDKTLGAAPWNTPSRDPSTLVAMSVRQIAQELGMRRFFTRRQG